MIRCTIVGLIALVLVAICSPAFCHEGEVWQISIPSTEQKLDEYAGPVSADGRYVVVVMRQLAGWKQVYVVDRLTGEYDPISVNDDGEFADGGHSSSKSISADGRFVAFSTDAGNLAGNETAYNQVYVRDRLLRTTRLITKSLTGNIYAYQSDREAISADGRYVACLSRVPMAPEDGGGVRFRVYLYDLVAGTRTHESVASDGSAADDNVSDPSMSADARYITFESCATNLGPGPHWSGGYRYGYVFIRDRHTGQTSYIDGDYAGASGTSATRPLFSANGSTIVFAAFPADRWGQVTNKKPALFMYERETGLLTSFVITGSSGQVGELVVTSVSGDGRYVVFGSDADGIVAGDSDGDWDVFEFDRVTHEVQAISMPGQGTAGGGRVTADGRYITFAGETNGSDSLMGVFIRQMLPGDEEVTAPAEWLNPGWNWFSIPLDPAGWPDPSHLLGLNVENRVYRLNPVDKWWELYPNDIHSFVRGRGYLLWLDQPIQPSYDALSPVGDFTIPLPEAGWTWIGCPYNHPVPIADLRIRHEPTGSVRTTAEDEAAADPWANWNLLWWESSVDTWGISSTSGGDTNSLAPWHGYLVWSYTRDTTLLVPGP